MCLYISFYFIFHNELLAIVSSVPLLIRNTDPGNIYITFAHNCQHCKHHNDLFLVSSTEALK